MILHTEIIFKVIGQELKEQINDTTQVKLPFPDPEVRLSRYSLLPCWHIFFLIVLYQLFIVRKKLEKRNTHTNDFCKHKKSNKLQADMQHVSINTFLRDAYKAPVYRKKHKIFFLEVLSTSTFFYFQPFP